MKEFELSDSNLRQVSPDIAILTYTATQDTTCGGQRLPAKVCSTALTYRASEDYGPHPIHVATTSAGDAHGSDGRSIPGGSYAANDIIGFDGHAIGRFLYDRHRGRYS
jgi:hypothetical protein